MAHQPVFLLIGGAGGIGAALARRLVNRGGCVVLAGRDESRTRALADELNTQARAAHAETVDATSFQQVQDLVARVLETQGRLDGVANLAGSILIKPVSSVSEAEFHETVNQNLTSAFAVVRAAARPMQKAGRGSIVLMSSCAARTGLLHHEAIAAAKAGVIGLTQAAAASLAASGVRVNCVAPGLTDTPMAARLTASDSARAASIAMHPLGRLGEPDDIARAVEWLLTDDASWVTGQTIGVDGGLAAIRGR
jgi:NAD(P)-dependent dehydrogenase (short-subunit alcohol dehydrogenase family)